MARKYRYFSADSHFERLPETWTHRVPAKYRDRARAESSLPTAETRSSKKDSRSSTAVPICSQANLLKEFNPVNLNFEGSAGAGSPEQRLKEQDADGIDGELLFATEARNTKIKDKDVFLRSSRRSTTISSRSIAPSIPIV